MNDGNHNSCNYQLKDAENYPLRPVYLFESIKQHPELGMFPSFWIEGLRKFKRIRKSSEIAKRISLHDYEE